MFATLEEEVESWRAQHDEARVAALETRMSELEARA
jgi:hypothetical protein